MSSTNDRGPGRVVTASPSDLFIPMQVPGGATALTVYTKPLSSSELYVNYSKPLSDGGAPVQGYKIEWDTSSSFGSSGMKEVRCPRYDVIPSRIVSSKSHISAGTCSQLPGNHPIDMPMRFHHR